MNNITTSWDNQALSGDFDGGNFSASGFRIANFEYFKALAERANAFVCKKAWLSQEECKRHDDRYEKVQQRPLFCGA